MVPPSLSFVLLHLLVPVYVCGKRQSKLHRFLQNNLQATGLEIWK
jgi:hypothetical protein